MILDIETSCNSLFTPDGLKIVREILNMIRIIAPIILILFTAIDFAGAVVNQDGSSFGSNSNIKKIPKRMIAVVLLFFVPTIVKAILSIDGIKIVMSSDPLCENAVGTDASDPLFFSTSYDDGVTAKKISTKSSTETKTTKETKTTTETKTKTDSNKVTYGPGNSKKKVYKTVTINGRTYDMYLQTSFPNVPFQGCDVARCGCSAIAFLQAASGFNQSLTVQDAVKLVNAKTFDGIKNALRSVNIPYSNVIYYNSNDNNQSRVNQIVKQVREHLKQGKPAIALIAGDGKYARNNHFVTLYGEDEKGRLILGNCRVEKGNLEEFVATAFRGGQKGIMLVG